MSTSGNRTSSRANIKKWDYGGVSKSGFTEQNNLENNLENSPCSKNNEFLPGEFQCFQDLNDPSPRTPQGSSFANFSSSIQDLARQANTTPEFLISHKLVGSSAEPASVASPLSSSISCNHSDAMASNLPNNLAECSVELLQKELDRAEADLHAAQKEEQDLEPKRVLLEKIAAARKQNSDIRQANAKTLTAFVSLQSEPTKTVPHASMKFGFPSNVEGEPPPSSIPPLQGDPASFPKNHTGATEFPEYIDNYIREELSHGALIGPLKANPFNCHAMLFSLPFIYGHFIRAWARAFGPGWGKPSFGFLWNSLSSH